MKIYYTKKGLCNLCRLKLILNRQKIILLIMSLSLPLINFFVVNINIYINDVLPIFKSLNGFDMMYIIFNDVMEIYMDLPIILLAVGTIIKKSNYSERIRFRSRGDLSKHYLIESFIMNFIFGMITIVSLYFFSYLLMPSKIFHWDTESKLLEIIFGEVANSKAILPWQNEFTILSTFFVKILFRNLVISTFLLILMIYLKKSFSLAISFGVSLYILGGENLFSNICNVNFLDFASTNRIIGNICMMIGILMIVFGAYYFLFTRKDYIDSVDKNF